MLISVVVPVYNTGKYLPECVDSILNQSYSDFELILVDDGSTDDSPAICDEYAERDKRVTVIHKENGGGSGARNAGIMSARGEYLLFIDGDDFIAEGSLDKLFETLREDGDADVVFLSAAHYFPDGRVKYFPEFFMKDKLYKKGKKDALDYISSLSDFNTSVCLKLMRREIISANNILFAENVTFAEDTDFSLSLFLYANTFNSCSSYIYYYRKGREDSATYDFSVKKYRDLLGMISKWTEKAEDDPECVAFREEIYKILAFQYCLLLVGNDKIERTFRKNITAETKKYGWLLDKSKDRRVTMVQLVYRFFGLRFTCAALALRERFFA